MSSLRAVIRVCNALLLLANGSALAEEMFTRHSGNEFQLSLAPEIGTLDNFFYQANNKQSTNYLALKTEVELQFQAEQQLLALDSKFHHLKYQQFSQDNHTDYSLAPSYQYKFAVNKAFFIESELNVNYEARGTGLSLGKASSLTVGDSKEQRQITAGLLYGQKDSIAKLILALGLNDSRYQTRRATTQVLDYQTQFVRSSFDYLLSDYSYLATELAYQDLTFDHNPLQDKDKLTALVGIKWQTTAATRLAALIGYQQVKFAQSNFKDDSALKWQLDWQWHPVEQIKFLLQSKRDFQEANRLTDSYRLIDAHRIDVQYRFNRSLAGSIALALNQEEIVYQTSATEEEYFKAEAQLDYQRLDWLAFYLRYVVSNLDAQQSTLDYQRSSVSIGFSVTI
ncbi:hypothetical protein tinsulaeT_14700 [Thalassotalea insulae]|uniref:Beta-barrel porin 2 n=1 Tax=Thalassotalea insulae TaxID=2056778 RepID=A0ABQ6GUG5_9GAMM|nr:outer membrane beta-barrel protein [Thalassotalea insulae]GLX78130.1 hypothetical protein tinsulaeT_14700 [Thalassotalea insulae]